MFRNHHINSLDESDIPMNDQTDASVPEPVAGANDETTMLGKAIHRFLQNTGWPNELFFQQMAVVAFWSNPRGDVLIPPDDPRGPQALAFVEWRARQAAERSGSNSPGVQRMYELLDKAERMRGQWEE